MMDGRQTDVEVGGSIAISIAEEAVTGSKRSSIAKEDSFQEKTNSRCAIEKSIVWKTFKNVVFLICLIFLLMQSAEFLHIYYKYPTNIVMETTVAAEFKLPAITYCFRNTIPYHEFCSYEPDWCEEPSDMDEFCSKHPFHCFGDISNLTVPVQNKTTRRIAMPYLFNDSFNDLFLDFDFKFDISQRTFVRDPEYPDMFLKCYSENLHLYKSEFYPDTWRVDFSDADNTFFAEYTFLQLDIELFYPIDEPIVYFTLHSPFVPIDPLELHPIKQGKSYRIGVQLEKEEHLLPPPYQTNCRDNGPSEDAEETDHPNSFQMCVEICRSEYAKAYSGCDWGMTMFSSPSDMCYGWQKVLRNDFSWEHNLELEEKRLICMQNCQQGCLKLQYKYIIKQFIRPGFSSGEYNHCDIAFYVKNPEVTVLRHVPLYGSSEIFSHVGGLLGCWLGISVFTFTDIMEKFCRRVVQWKERFRKKKEQKATISEIHLD